MWEEEKICLFLVLISVDQKQASVPLPATRVTGCPEEPASLVSMKILPESAKRPI